MSVPDDATPAPASLDVSEATFLRAVRLLPPDRRAALLRAMQRHDEGEDFSAAMIGFGIECGRSPEEAAAVWAESQRLAEKLMAGGAA